MLTRRQLLQSAGTAAVAALGAPLLAEEADSADPVRTITSGPKHHWFGYYDKLEFDPTDRYVLANEVDFEHRTPTAEDTIRVGMVDTGQGDEWIELGTSRAWGWQQGCMLQWRPPSPGSSATEVVWNDREGDRHVCRVLDVKTREARTLPRPVYSLSSDGRWAVTADFARIQRMRPGYGYVGLEDPCRAERAPEDSGVWRMDMDTGESKLIFSLADAAQIPHHSKTLADKWNYFNHLLVSPDSQRFIVLHRWRESSGSGPDAEPVGSFTTRMFTVAMDGSDRYLLDPSGHTSHFFWRDPQSICAWSKPAGHPAGFYLFQDKSSDVSPVGRGVMTQDGHNTYLPVGDNEWILCDSYPDKRTREQSLYLYHVPTKRRVPLGRFHSSPKYTGEWRCDLHPRSNNAGTAVAIDSPHTGAGRQVHLVDVSGVVG